MRAFALVRGRVPGRLAASRAAAQFAARRSGSPGRRRAGRSRRPSRVSTAWDDNVVAGRASTRPTASDPITVLTPSADAAYRARHNWIGVGLHGLVLGLPPARRAEQLRPAPARRHPARALEARDAAAARQLRGGADDRRRHAQRHPVPANRVAAQRRRRHASASPSTRAPRRRRLRLRLGGLRRGSALRRLPARRQGATAFSGGRQRQIAPRWVARRHGSFRRSLMARSWRRRWTSWTRPAPCRTRRRGRCRCRAAFGVSRLSRHEPQTRQDGPAWNVSAVQRFSGRRSAAPGRVRSSRPSAWAARCRTSSSTRTCNAARPQPPLLAGRAVVAAERAADAGGADAASRSGCRPRSATRCSGGCGSRLLLRAPSRTRSCAGRPDAPRPRSASRWSPRMPMRIK